MAAAGKGEVMRCFDCLILGGGSGGISMARRAASYGKKVVVVENNKLGGTCVNVGCVPKKVLWCAANVYESLHGISNFGITTGNPTFNWGLLKQNRDNYINRLNEIYRRNLKSSTVEYLNAFGSLTRRTDDGLFEVTLSKDTTTTEVLAKHVFIAVGGAPVKPKFPGGELCVNSDDFFHLKEQPNRAAVIGAGYIAVEISGVLQALGTSTELFVRYHASLRKFDPMITQHNDANLKKLGIKMHPNSMTQEVKKTDDGLMLTLTSGQTHGPFDIVLVATGRFPLVQNLGLENLNVKSGKAGHIVVDKYQNTSVDGIYALGDVCGEVELTPMAIAAGRRLADRLYGGMPDACADYENVPTVIFAHPPIGTVGMSEPEAVDMFGEKDVKVYTGSCVNLYYGCWPIPPEEKPKTHFKLICIKSQKEKVVGLHMIGMGVDEMLQGFGVAIKMGATKSDFDRCVAIHPTGSEEIVTLPPWGLSGRL